MPVKPYTKVGPSASWPISAYFDKTFYAGGSYHEEEGSHINVPSNYDEGEYLPEWREISQSGGNATTNRSARKYHLVSKGGELHWEYGFNDITATEMNVITGDLSAMINQDGIPWPSQPSEDNLGGLALSKLYSKISQQVNAFQGGTFVGELRELNHQIRGRTGSLVKAISASVQHYAGTKRIRSKKKPRIRTLTNKQVRRSGLLDWSSYYLETMLGWLPLAADIEGLSKALVDKRSEPYTTKVRASAFTQSQTVSEYGASVTASSPCRVLERTYSRKRVSYEAGLRIEPYVYQGKRLDTLGFGLSNFIPTLYELIPYSFAIDYFSNLGTVIEAATSLKQYISWSSKSFKWLGEHSIEARPLLLGNHDGNFHILSSGGDGGICLRRTSGIDREVPDLSLGLQVYLPGSDSFKWLTVAMLALQKSALKTIN